MTTTRELLENNFKRFFLGATENSAVESTIDENSTIESITENVTNSAIESTSTEQKGELQDDKIPVSETISAPEENQTQDEMAQENSFTQENAVSSVPENSVADTQKSDTPEKDDLTTLYEAKKEALQNMGVLSKEAWLYKLASVEKTLDENPLSAVSNLIESYGIDKEALARKLIEEMRPDLKNAIPQTPQTLQASQTGQTAQTGQASSESALPQMQANLQATMAQIASLMAEQQEMQRQQALDYFLAQKDEQGQARYPYAQEVRETLNQLLRHNPTAPIQKLYEHAVWLTPQVRESIIAQKAQATIKAKAKKDDSAKIASFSPDAHQASAFSKMLEKPKTTRELLETSMREAGLL